MKKILNESYERAKAILKAHAKEHKALAEALLKYETLDAEDIKAILAGDKISPDSSHWVFRKSSRFWVKRQRKEATVDDLR